MMKNNVNRPRNRGEIFLNKPLSKLIAMSYSIRRNLSLPYFEFGLSSLQTHDVISNKHMKNSYQN